MRGIKHLLLPIYRIAAMVGIIEWNEFHSCLRLEALDALHQGHLGGIILGCLLTELHSELHFHLVACLPLTRDGYIAIRSFRSLYLLAIHLDVHLGCPIWIAETKGESL